MCVCVCVVCLFWFGFSCPLSMWTTCCYTVTCRARQNIRMIQCNYRCEEELKKGPEDSKMGSEVTVAFFGRGNKKYSIIRGFSTLLFFQRKENPDEANAYHITTTQTRIPRCLCVRFHQLTWWTKTSRGGSTGLPSLLVIEINPNPIRTLNHLQKPDPDRT